LESPSEIGWREIRSFAFFQSRSAMFLMIFLKISILFKSINVNLEKLVVVVGQRWSFVYWTETDGGDPLVPNAPRIRSSGEDIDVCLEATLEISKFRGANFGLIDSQFIDSGFECNPIRNCVIDFSRSDFWFFWRQISLPIKSSSRKR
jgi:hypothetical protein